MQLRPRQVQAKDRCVPALKEKKNTLLVAPTGAGKTVMLSAVIGELAVKKTLVLQHRTELVDQNRSTFERMNPHMRTGAYNANYKETWPDVIFGMIQTVSRGDNMLEIPNPDLIVVDEAHHSAADSYLKTLQHFKVKNPDLMVFGVTATPQRGDKKAIRMVYDNCADQITLSELIREGHLVRPRCLVVDIGVQEELKNVKKTALDFDMAAVEAIMDRAVLNDKIVAEWKERAGDRLTVVFCSTIDHAKHVTEAFVNAGVKAAVVHSDLSDGERAAILSDFDKGVYQVLVNVAILTEGWDCQPVSCVILLRPSSYKSTMIQMIGRGLRKLDPERYPGQTKDDCIVLDFGTSILIHGDINQEVVLANGSTQVCHECQAVVPGQCFECPVCGAELRPHEATEREAAGVKDPKIVLNNFQMTEIDVLNDSPMKWIDIFDGKVMIASAFTAWGIVVNYRGRWHAIGGSDEVGVKHLQNVAGDQKILALAAADDFIRQYGDTKTARKSKGWMREPATDYQLKILGLDRNSAMGLTKYEATCYLTWRKAEKIVRRKLEDSSQLIAAA